MASMMTAHRIGRPGRPRRPRRGLAGMTRSAVVISGQGRPGEKNCTPVAGDGRRPPVPSCVMADYEARHQNLTSWFPSVHFLFARGYRRPSQTVLAHHGLQADRPSEAALFAAGKGVHDMRLRYRKQAATAGVAVVALTLALGACSSSGTSAPSGGSTGTGTATSGGGGSSNLSGTLNGSGSSFQLSFQ